MKNIIVVTGGAGFIGSNLIEFFLKHTKLKFISIDNYSSGTKKNHIKDSRVKYIKSNTIKIDKVLKKFKPKIQTVFHLGEFSRIYQSFSYFDECFNSNVIGSKSVFKFCLTNKIRLIYSSTSATFGNNGADKNLSPYAFTKAKNLELLMNLKNWFNFKYDVIYFYNVYGPRQISEGDMATVVGIFEKNFLNKKKLPVVRPGTQRRKFTHVNDVVKACFEVWKKNQNKHYAVFNPRSYSIIELSKMFHSKINWIPKQQGERFCSYLNKSFLGQKIIKIKAKINLRTYIKNFIIKSNIK